MSHMFATPTVTGSAGDTDFQRDFTDFLKSPSMQKVLKEEQEKSAAKTVRRKQKYVAFELHRADKETQDLIGPFVQMPFVADLLISLTNDLRDPRPLSEKLQEPRLRQLFLRLRQTAKTEAGDLTRVQEEWYQTCLNVIKEEQSKKKPERLRMGSDTLVPMMNSASACKADGNKAFREGDMKEALDCYTKGVQALAPVRGGSAADAAIVDDLYFSLLLNQAAAALKLEEYRIAREACEKYLEVRKDDVKALFRHGVACGKLHDVQTARKSLERALELDPQCEEATKALEQLERDIEKWSRDEKELCKKMFGGR